MLKFNLIHFNLQNITLKSFILPFILYSFIFINSSFNLIAQLDKAAYYNYGTPLFAEYSILPTSTKDSNKIVILYKIQYNSLTFKQSTRKETFGKYESNPEIELILKDKDGITRRRSLIKDTIVAKSFEETTSKSIYYSNYVEFTVLPLEYKLTIEFTKPPKNSKLSFDINVNLDFYSNKLVTSTPILISRKVKESSKFLLPYIMNKKIAYSSVDTGILLPITYQENEKFYYTITKKESKENKNQINNSQANLNKDKLDFRGIAKLHKNSNLKIVKFKIDKDNLTTLKSNSNPNFNPNFNTMYSNNVFYDIEPFSLSVTSNNIGVLDIEFPSNYYEIGKYEVSVFNDSSSDTNKFEFEVIWENQPLCLKNIEYSIEIMNYILSDEALQNMQSGDEIEMKSKFDEYWSTKDPTPVTPFNEALYQYFARVDYSFFNYQSISQVDGAKTDKGKIHILYGMPDNMENNFVNGRQEEIWTYNKQKKKYFFSSVATGLLKLSKIEDID